MSDIEDIKKKKLEELQKKEMKQKQKAVKKAAISQILDKGAKRRLSNLKLTKPEMAEQIESYLIQIKNTGQLQTPVTESQMVEILKMLSPNKEWNIKRK